MKTSASGLFREVGEWQFIPSDLSAAQGTLIFETEVELYFNFDSSTSQISVECRDQKLHLVS